MTDKEKIIAYIDKLLEKYPKNYYLLIVAEFIDSLQEEPVSEDFDVLDQLLAKYAIDFSYKGKTLKECSDRYKAEIIATANHLEPVSEDLEEANQKQKDLIYPLPLEDDFDDPCFSLSSEIKSKRIGFDKGFKTGAEWQKEEMMKDTVDAFIYNGNIRLKKWPLPEKYGKHLDSVKLIIIKKNKDE